MRLLLAIAPVAFALLLVISGLPQVFADDETYELVVSDDPADIGQDVSATATTDNTEVPSVRFIWKNPSGIVVRDVEVSGPSPFEDSYVVDEIGDWKVIAVFTDDDDEDDEDEFEVEAVVKVTFLVVPEFPFGSIVAVAAIFGAVLVYGKLRV